MGRRGPGLWASSKVCLGQAMEGRGTQERFLMSQDHLQAPEHHIPSRQPGAAGGTRSSWPKPGTDRRRQRPEQGQGSWEEERDTAPAARAGVWKAKAQLEVSLGWDVQGNKGCPAPPSFLELLPGAQGHFRYPRALCRGLQPQKLQPRCPRHTRQRQGLGELKEAVDQVQDHLREVKVHKS